MDCISFYMWLNLDTLAPAAPFPTLASFPCYKVKWSVCRIDASHAKICIERTLWLGWLKITNFLSEIESLAHRVREKN